MKIAKYTIEMDETRGRISHDFKQTIAAAACGIGEDYCAGEGDQPAGVHGCGLAGALVFDGADA